MRRASLRGLAVAAAAVLAGGLLTACGGSGGPPTLTWYINPDNGGQVKLAAECSAASNGAYKIKTSLLPADATLQRQQLVTRLSAKDNSISLMSLDPIFLPEFAEAGFLDPIPKADVASFTKDIVKPAVTAATWQGKLVAAPFYANVQLLWYRKSAVKQAGLDMSKPVTWDQIITAAQKLHRTVAVQADLYEGYAVLINALIQGGGGKIVQNPGADADNVKLGLTTSAGKDAASIIQKLVKAGVGGPALSTSEEGQSLALFQQGNGAFLVNWPYVWAALTPAQRKDTGFTTYPETIAGKSSKPPFGGIDIAMGAYASHKTQVRAAQKCLTTAPHQEQYMLAEGNPAANATVYTKPDIVKAYPDGLAAEVLKNLKQAGPRPQSQYYNDLSEALQQSFSPPSSVNSNTPAKAQKFILQVLKGEKLL